MKPTLLILAAGMGSRYGGLKQLDPVGPSGEVIMDYSVYDAIQAGFGKVVFVIRRDFEEQFKTHIGTRFETRIETEYAFQSLDDLPRGFAVPAGREKPWGTSHAILAARSVIKEPFCMINADDFYGSESYRSVCAWLSKASPDGKGWCMAGYKIGNTLSAYGGVTRALCIVKEGRLARVVEKFKIVRDGTTAVCTNADGTSERVPLDTPVSMNFWGFTPKLFAALEDGFVRFLEQHGTDPKAEYLIPTAVDELIQSGAAAMTVLRTDASWFGVTYPEDKARVQQSVRQLVDGGVYPSPLW
ncbi:nucleotidyltransferase [bacterium]|nr:nucleotidyltransferase [bacterium]